jgi:uracil phosphoribosyltransferase
MVHELSRHHSIFNQFLAELRDADIQKDPMRFRQNLQRIGQSIGARGFEGHVTYKPIEVVTPLGIAETTVLEEQPVLCSILRAGLPMHQGFLDYFDRADNAFATAYRRHHKGGDFEIEVEYVSSPSAHRSRIDHHRSNGRHRCFDRIGL